MMPLNIYLFNYAFSEHRLHTALSGGISVNDELRRMWKEAETASFKVLSIICQE
jgi:hypothetical protein